MSRVLLTKGMLRRTRTLAARQGAVAGGQSSERGLQAVVEAKTSCEMKTCSTRSS
jgi:hypothetical protein